MSDVGKDDYKHWMARVKYNDGIVEDVPVRKIKTKDKAAFKPTSFTDFSNTTLYSVKTNLLDCEKKEQRYWAWIGRLAASKQDLDSGSKRIRWPSVWPLPSNDEPANTSQDEQHLRKKLPASSAILRHREIKAAKVQKKKSAEEDCAMFLSYNSVLSKNRKEESPPTALEDDSNQTIAEPSVDLMNSVGQVTTSAVEMEASWGDSSVKQLVLQSNDKCNAFTSKAGKSASPLVSISLDDLTELLDKRDEKFKSSIKEMVSECVKASMEDCMSSFERSSSSKLRSSSKSAYVKE